MMKRLVLVGSLVLSSGLAHASTATVSLSTFLQDVNVTNNAGSTSNITSVIYSLGPPGDGIATWQTSGLGEGAHADPVSADRFQTRIYTDVIAPNTSLFEGTGDIDLIETLSPFVASDSILDTVGTSLAGAFVKVLWADGSFGQASLSQTAWATDQILEIGSSASSATPLPAALPLFATGLGALGLIGWRRKRKALAA